MEDRDRFEARRWETRDSSGAASRSGENCREGILSLEDDMLKQWMFYMFVDDQADGEGVGRRHIVLSVGSIGADLPDIIRGHRLLPDSCNTVSMCRPIFTVIITVKVRSHHWRPRPPVRQVGIMPARVHREEAKTPKNLGSLKVEFLLQVAGCATTKSLQD